MPTEVGMGLIPGQETKSHMPHDASESREEKSMHVKVVVPMHKSPACFPVPRRECGE